MVPCGLAPDDPDHACPTGGAAEKAACRDRSAVSAPARPAVERGHGGRGRLCGLVPVPRSDSAGPGKRCGAAQIRKRPYSLCQGPNSVGRSRLIDSTPLPCAASRGTVERSDLAGRCGYGYCRRHSGLSWGLRLYLVTTAERGMPVTRWLANPKLGKREVMTALLERDHRLVHAGQVILTDKGLAGKELEAFLAERLGVHLVRPDRKDEPARHGEIARVRQWIEAVIDTFKGRLSLEQDGGRTPAGVFARTGQRLLALAAGVRHTWTTDAKTERSLIAYDH